VVENLYRSFMVETRYYCPRRENYLQPEMKTLDFATSADVVTPDDAYNFLLEIEAEQEAFQAAGEKEKEALGSASCVITF
jgi:hypothetical protein